MIERILFLGGIILFSICIIIGIDTVRTLNKPIPRSVVGKPIPQRVVVETNDIIHSDFKVK
jgi:hypothetical protein